MLGELLGREVNAHQIPEQAWIETLRSIVFSPTNAQYMADMTAAVISGLTAAEGKTTVMPTSFPDYARQYIATEA